MKIKTTQLFTLITALLLPGTIPVHADAVPEPGYVMYGSVYNVAASGARVTTGVIEWTVIPVSGGAPITVTAALEDIGGQYSYRLRIPFESLLGSSMVSPTALAANTAATTYNRATVNFRAGTNVFAATNVAPALTSFSFKSADRAITEKVDLMINAPPALISSSATFIDSDNDGMSDAAEIKAGIDPNDAKSYFRFESINRQSDGSIQLKWLSVKARTYELLRANSLPQSSNDYIRIAGGIVSTPGTNTYVDTNIISTNLYFYRVGVE